MYTNLQNGQAGCANSHAPTLHLGTYRRAIMAVLSADVFTPAERVLANHNVHECEDSAKLALWLKNVRRVFTEREAVLEQADLAEVTEVVAPVQYATAQQTSEVHKLALHRAITVGERTKAMLALPRLDYGAATALIGELWAKILHRTGQQGGAASSAPDARPDSTASYSSAS
jgi:hypothetical protein